MFHIILQHHVIITNMATKGTRYYFLVDKNNINRIFQHSVSGRPLIVKDIKHNLSSSFPFLFIQNTNITKQPKTHHGILCAYQVNNIWQLGCLLQQTTKHSSFAKIIIQVDNSFNLKVSRFIFYTQIMALNDNIP